MCPDKKIKWFKDRPGGRTRSELNKIKKLVVDRWNDDFKGDDPATPQRPAKVFSEIIF
jgi:hypothetical protein